MNVFVMHRGNDKKYEIAVTDKETGGKIDITGCTLTLTWKAKKSDESYFLQKTASLTDPFEGIGEFTIDAADTSGLTEEKEFFWDVLIEKVDTTKETLCEGKIQVLLGVST